MALCGRPGLVAGTDILVQIPTILVAFAHVMIDIPMIPVYVAVILGQIFSVAADIAVRRIHILVSGIDGGYRRQREGGTKNQQTRFMHEACSPVIYADKG